MSKDRFVITTSIDVTSMADQLLKEAMDIVKQKFIVIFEPFTSGRSVVTGKFPIPRKATLGGIPVTIQRTGILKLTTAVDSFNRSEIKGGKFMVSVTLHALVGSGGTMPMKTEGDLVSYLEMNSVPKKGTKLV